MAQSVSELGVKPAKAVTSWLTDQIAPAYWKPNSLISVSDASGPTCLPPTSSSQVNTFLTTDIFFFFWLPPHSSNATSRLQVTRLKPFDGSGSVVQLCVIMPFLVLSFVSKVCHKCQAVFQDNDTKHHCRACGEGFCHGCSSKSVPVPERGWGVGPVRVCDVCFEQRAAYAGTHI